MDPIHIPEVIRFVTEWRQSKNISEDGPLNENQCIQLAHELNEKISHMNFNAPTPGASYVMYSDGKFTNGTSTSEVAHSLAQNSNGKYYTKDDTEPGKLLHDEEFKQALIKAFGSEELANRMLHGTPRSQLNQNSPQKIGFWAQVRHNYAVWWNNKRS